MCSDNASIHGALRGADSVCSTAESGVTARATLSNDTNNDVTKAGDQPSNLGPHWVKVLTIPAGGTSASVEYLPNDDAN